MSTICCVLDDEKYLRGSKTLKEVLKGNFPEHAVNKMNSSALRRFVTNLVNYTSAKAGEKAVVDSSEEKPMWWPDGVIFDTLLFNKDKKEFRNILQHLVKKCCDFFRNGSCKQKWLPNGNNHWINDENLDVIKTKGVKRKNSDILILNNPIKKRRTLISKNDSAIEVQKSDIQEKTGMPIEAVVQLQDIFKGPTSKESLNQQQFLEIFELGLNNNYKTPTPDSPHSCRFPKLNNYPNIPLSSDIGKAIMKKENPSTPDYATRKLERLEWYLNRKETRGISQEYEVSFENNKIVQCRIYRFPRRQYHQLGCNIHYNNFLLKLCKPLCVHVEREDLVLKKKYYDSLKVKVNMCRLSINELNKHLCKDLKIVVTPNFETIYKNSRRNGLRPYKFVKLKQIC